MAAFVPRRLSVEQAAPDLLRTATVTSRATATKLDELLATVEGFEGRLWTLCDQVQAKFSRMGPGSHVGDEGEMAKTRQAVDQLIFEVRAFPQHGRRSYCDWPQQQRTRGPEGH